MKNNTIGEILRNARKATSPVIDLATIKDYINENMHRDQNGRLVRNETNPEQTKEERAKAYAEYIRSMRAEDAGLWDTRGE